MQERPLLLSFVLSSSCILFSFLLVFCGDKIPHPFTLTVYDEAGHARLTIFGWITSILCLIWTFLVQASEKYYEYVSAEKVTDAEATNYIRGCVDICVENVCNNKYNTLISLIQKIIEGKKKPPYIVSKPCEQLKTITKELASCLRTLLMHGGYHLEENEMYVSIFYKFHTADKWRQTQSAFPEMGLSVEDVASNSKSTFSSVLKSKNGVLFINDKQDGYLKEQYVPDKDDKYDENNKLMGSILCYRISCPKNGVDYITAVVSVSTYIKKIEPSNIPEKIRNTQENIYKYIIRVFEKRIKIELCLLYLYELYSEKKKNSAIKSPQIQRVHIENTVAGK